MAIQGGLVNFKLDSGVDVTIIAEATLNQMKPKPKLKSVYTRVTSPRGQLACLGQFVARSIIDGQPLHYRVIVAKTTDNLLSRSVAVKMGFMKRVYVDEIQDVYGDISILQCDPVKILLRDNATQYSVCTARRVPIPLLPQFEAELRRMEQNGIIERVTEPTDWCAPMVPVMRPKKGKVRICVDLRRLNESVMREKRTLPILDDVLHKLTGSPVFSKLDASSGFLQIPLDIGSSKLTTFITPFGRYCFRRLPFGITSAPEIFQDKMEQLLEGLPGVEVIMDDILIHGETRAKHDEHYENVLRAIRASGLKLDKDKCLLRQSKLVFMGNFISKDGLEPDQEKVDAICKMSAPENVTELRRLLGMANYLCRFLPDLSTVLKPITDLLKSDM